MIATLFPVVFALIYAGHEHKATEQATLVGILTKALSQAEIQNSLNKDQSAPLELLAESLPDVLSPAVSDQSAPLELLTESLPDVLSPAVSDDESKCEDNKLPLSTSVPGSEGLQQQVEAIELGTHLGAAFLDKGRLAVQDIYPISQTGQEKECSIADVYKTLSTQFFNISILPNRITPTWTEVLAVKAILSNYLTWTWDGLENLAAKTLPYLSSLKEFVQLVSNGLIIRILEHQELYWKALPWTMSVILFGAVWFFFTDLVALFSTLKTKTTETCRQGSVTCITTIQRLRQSSVSLYDFGMMLMQRSVSVLHSRDEIKPITHGEEKQSMENIYSEDSLGEEIKETNDVGIDKIEHEIVELATNTDDVSETLERSEEIVSTDVKVEEDNVSWSLKVEEDNISDEEDEDNISKNSDQEKEIIDMKNSILNAELSTHTIPETQLLHLDATPDDDDDDDLDIDEGFATSTPRSSSAPLATGMESLMFQPECEDKRVAPRQLQRFLHEQYNRLRVLGISFDANRTHFLNMSEPNGGSDFVGSLDSYVEDTRHRIKRRLLNMSSIV